MIKKISVLALALCFSVWTNTFAEGVIKESEEALKALELKATDNFEGKKDAPIQVVEYASMTCSHCADFHTKYYHEIKEKLIDTGKVRFIFRELPWDNRALAVSMVSRCAPKEEYFNFVSAYMSTRKSWAESEKFLASVKQVARLGGMPPKAVDACLKNEEVNDIIRKNYKEGVEVVKIKGTPTFFVNGFRVEGIMTTEHLLNLVEGIEKKAN